VKTTPPPMLTVTLLGQPEATWSGAIVDLLRRQTRALFYRLAVRPDALAREQLCFLFWPDTADATARRNLTRLLTHLRRALPAPDLLSTTAESVRLDAVRIHADTAEFERLSAEADRHQDRGSLEQVVALYRGPFLDGFSLPECAEYEAWLAGERRIFERLYLQALATLIDHKAEQRDYTTAIAYARRYLAHDELDEVIHCRLIELYAASGDRSAALRQFEECIAILERELGVDPLPATRAAYEAALAEQPAPPSQTIPALKWATLPGLDLPMVGRNEALIQLEQWYRQATRGKGKVVFIAGEAGVGKSRLVQEFATRPGKEALVLAGAGQPGEQALPYRPIAQALRRGIHLVNGNLSVDAIWLAEASLVLPELRSLRPNLPAPLQTDPQQARTRLFEALARLTLTLANGPHPLLLCLDDLHWTDSATLDWIAYLGEHIQDNHLLVVGTYRKEEPDTVAPLRQRLMRQGVLHEIALDGLDASAVYQLLHHADRSMQNGDTLARRLQRATGGNAFFLTETVRSLLSASRTLDEQDQMEIIPIPETVSEAVSIRLNQLSQVARQMLEAGAVLGLTFSYPLIRQTAGRTEMEAVDGLDELVGNYVLQPEADGFHFHHDIIRMVVYEHLSPWRRRLLHRRAAETLEDLDPGAAESISGQIAFHFEEAGLLEQALPYYRRAADWMRRIYANDEASARYQRLLSPDLSPLLPSVERCQIMLSLGEVWQIQSEFARAEEVVRHALSLAETIYDQQLQGRCQQALGNMLRLQSRYEEALPWLTEARATLQRLSDKQALVRVLWTIGETYWFTGNYSEALAVLDEQMALATELNDQRGIADGASTKGMIYWGQGRLEEAETSCLHSYETARQIDHRWSMGRAALTLGNIYGSRRDSNQALTWYGEVTLPLTRQVNDRQCMSWALGNIAIIYAGRGDFDLALPYALCSLQTAIQIGDLWAASVALANIADWYAEQANWDHAFRFVEKAIALVRAMRADYLYGYLGNLVSYHERRQAYREAQMVNDEVLSALQERDIPNIGGEDVLFQARMADIRLRAVLGRMSVFQATEELNQMLVEYQDADKEATIHYELWRLDRSRTGDRDKAAHLYRTLYETQGHYDPRKRYHELTGEDLPDPPPLPELADDPPVDSVDVEHLLAEVDQVIDKMVKSKEFAQDQP
jgi:DNA-binding SARP family transcriptional activator/tetratricopeptide (TPR) repeat protein